MDRNIQYRKNQCPLIIYKFHAIPVEKKNPNRLLVELEKVILKNYTKE